MYDIFAKLIEERGVTIYRVAKETKIAQATLIDWKNGKYTPKLDKLQRIADYFGVTVDYLMGKEKPATDDDELTDYLEMLRTRPECRMLFKLSKSATKEDVENAVKIIEALRK